MIFGNINTFKSCSLGSETLEKCLAVLRSLPEDEPLGRVEVGDGIFYTVMDAALSEREGKKFEYHLKYTDIQYLLGGEEEMAVGDTESLTPAVEYDEAKDIGFVIGTQSAYLSMKKGDFAVFCPHDAHMPNIGKNGTCSRKVVMKVPVKE